MTTQSPHDDCAARRWLASLLLLAAACPGKDGLLTEFSPTTACPSGDDCEESSAGESSTTVGASATTADPSATSTSGATTFDPSGTTGEPGLCEDPSDPVIGPGVTVTVRNAGATDIFVRGGGNCHYPAYSLVDPANELLVTWRPADCPRLCGQALVGDCDCGDFQCDVGVIRIVPGGSFVDNWTGGHFLATELPAACVAEVCLNLDCAVQLQGTAGTYTFAAYSRTEFKCLVGDCACEPNADGWCDVHGAVIDDETIVESQLVYPDADAVELVFQ